MYECANSFITYNNLNIPSYDVHSVQARDQMLVNLYKLHESFVKINNTITEKTKQQNQRIEKIRQRIRNCMVKIQEVEGINKAICFVSPGEYPIKYKFDPEKNVSIFKQFIERTKVNKFDLQAHYQMKHEIQKIGSASKLQLENLYKFVLYLYGKLKCKKMSILESGISQKKVKSNNLGRIPNTIRYVDSLTIFDTYINPYKNYELAPKKVIKKRQEKKKLEEEQQIISITTYAKPSYEIANPNYKPVTQEIADIDLDDDIGLDNVVDIDLDDFLSGMTPTPGTVEKKVLEDPYKNQKVEQKSATNNYPEQNAQPEYRTLQSTAFTSATTQSTSSGSGYQSTSAGSLPPPPPPPYPSLDSLNLGSLPPPPPPPPTLESFIADSDLPPPPGGLPPSLDLAPPPLLTGPPPLLSTPPPLSTPLSAPSGGGGGRMDLLKELQNSNPMARLKKTVTKQTPNILPTNKPRSNNDGGQGGESTETARPVSHMEALQIKIRNRFKALHPDREQDQENR